MLTVLIYKSDYGHRQIIYHKYLLFLYSHRIFFNFRLISCVISFFILFVLLATTEQNIIVMPSYISFFKSTWCTNQKYVISQFITSYIIIYGDGLHI